MSVFDIITVSFNRAETLKNFLDSLASPMPSGLGKIYILVLKQDHQTLELLDQYKMKFPIVVESIDSRINPGASRNLLMAKATSSYICFLDDDAECPEGYFVQCLNLIKQERLIFGGPDKSPFYRSEKQKIMGEILSHPFVMGPTFKRHSTETKESASAKESDLTLCNLWMKRELLVENKLAFNEKIRRCEENMLLEELNSLGIPFFYDPKIFVFHNRREKIIEIAQIQFLSGYYRSVCFFINKMNFKVYFIIPAIIGFLISFCAFVPPSILVILFLLHMLISAIIITNKENASKDINSIFWAWLVIFTIHVFFSLGIFWGIVLGWKEIERT